jgi:diketogulonate reductase-like aldo/keto reductase
MIEFCKERDIHITAYSPLGAPNRDWARPDEPKLMEDSTIKEMAEKYKKTPAQLIIRYQVYNPLLSILKFQKF